MGVLKRFQYKLVRTKFSYLAEKGLSKITSHNITRANVNPFKKIVIIISHHSEKKAIRIKPLTEHDLESLPTRFQRQIVTTTPYATNQIIVEGEKRQIFNFDHVYPPETNQQEIYEKSVENLVSKFLEGKIS